MKTLGYIFLNHMPDSIGACHSMALEKDPRFAAQAILVGASGCLDVYSSGEW